MTISASGTKNQFNVSKHDTGDLGKSKMTPIKGLTLLRKDSL